MKTIPWIENNIPLKEWIETITVTAQLLDYDVDITSFHYDYLYDRKNKKHVFQPGINWLMNFSTKSKDFNYFAISFVDGLPIRLEISINDFSETYYSTNIDDLSAYQKIIEEWIT